MLTHDELGLLANCGTCDAQGDTAYVFDADNAASVEVICDNCRGIGHLKRKCPSSRRFRSFKLAIQLNQQALEKAEARATKYEEKADTYEAERNALLTAEKRTREAPEPSPPPKKPKNTGLRRQPMEKQ